jgi:hypothetical protein
MTQHGPQLRINYDPEQARKAMADLAAAIGATVELIRESFTVTAEQLQQLGVIAAPRSADPRARALWAKANRGTGPATSRNWAKR